MDWNEKKILALAPDRLVGNWAKGLLTAFRNGKTFFRENLIWSEFKPFRGEPCTAAVVIDQRPGFFCSCPSSKNPCQHSLSLFLHFAEAPASFRLETEPPPMILEWLEKRNKREMMRKNRVIRPIDSDAFSRVSPRRMQLMEAGLIDLQQFLFDVLQQGFHTLASRPNSFFEDRASRLVDAQLPTLARRMRLLPALLQETNDWPEALLSEFSFWTLLIQAFKSRGSLNPALAFDLLAALGVYQKKEEVTATPTNSLTGDWVVLSVNMGKEEKLTYVKTWFAEKNTGNTAYSLDFFFHPPEVDSLWKSGDHFSGTCFYYPSVLPLRAVFPSEQVKSAPEELLTFPRAFATMELLLDAYADGLAKLPWMQSFPAFLEGVVPVITEVGLQLVDADKKIVPLDPSAENLKLLAISGGSPIAVFGTWSGASLLVLAALCAGRLISISQNLEG